MTLDPPYPPLVEPSQLTRVTPNIEGGVALALVDVVNKNRNIFKMFIGTKLKVSTLQINQIDENPDLKTLLAHC